MTGRGTESAIRVGLVYPELLGTYGDRGNAVVLVERARWCGLQAELVEVAAGTTIPESLDVYLFGGGEDDPQTMAAAGMRESAAGIRRAMDGGAVVLAVCAGFQLVGTGYVDAGGEVIEGIGLVDATTEAGAPRLIGEVIVEPDPSTGLPTITGFENHGGRTTLGPGVTPLGRVTRGGGNGVGGVDGALAPNLVATYLHGPVLPRNPALADLLLEWVTGETLAPLPSVLEDSLRAERLAEARLTGWRARARDLRLERG